MSSQFLFHDGVDEIVPYEGRYSFPSQATRTLKSTVKLQPKNSKASYGAGDTIAFELPAQGYLNPIHTMLTYKLAKSGGTSPRMQVGANSPFRRMRVLYGSLVIEDVYNYHLLNRILMEAGVNLGYTYRDGAIHMNMGDSAQRAAHQSGKRFTTPILSGILSQRKLIPLKWMASQLRIEFEIAPVEEFMIADGTSTALTASISEPELITDILEFDSSYDAAFFEGLQASGIPIQFNSWHSSVFSVTSTNTQLQIQERSRSVKLALACLVASSANRTSDAHCTFSTGKPTLHAANTAAAYAAAQAPAAAGNSRVTSYQYRLGGRYFPSQPVNVHDPSTAVTGAGQCEGEEAFFELQKALNKVSNFQASTNVGPGRWCSLANQSFTGSLTDANGNRDIVPFTTTGAASPYAIFAADLETSNGMEIAGVNSEEQSDINLSLAFNSAEAPSGVQAVVFTCFDALMVIKQNNVVDLIS
jgi:hypothetical protein